MDYPSQQYSQKPQITIYPYKTIMIYIIISLDQNKLFVSESLPPLTQLANGYKEPTIQFSEL